MRVHRSAHARNFTVLPNALLQQRRLTYTARGLLIDLLSRPDYWREDGRAMADSSPQGRGAIRKALKELTEAGYYRVVKIRMPDGTIRSEAHVFDTPQLELPGVPRPDSGSAKTGAADAPLVKNRVQETSLPVGQADQPLADAEAGDEPGGREGDHNIEQEPPAVPDEQARAAALTLFRAIKPEPRLRLGEAEAMELAPLVTQWLERGSTSAELAQALLSGLPATVHSPVGVLRNRLQRKMPPAHAPEQPTSKPSYDECAKCHDPVPQPGICPRAPASAPERSRSGAEPQRPSAGPHLLGKRSTPPRPVCASAGSRVSPPRCSPRLPGSGSPGRLRPGDPLLRENGCSQDAEKGRSRRRCGRCHLPEGVALEIAGALRRVKPPGGPAISAPPPSHGSTPADETSDASQEYHYPLLTGPCPSTIGIGTSHRATRHPRPHRGRSSWGTWTSD